MPGVPLCGGNKVRFKKGKDFNIFLDRSTHRGKRTVLYPSIDKLHAFAVFRNAVVGVPGKDGRVLIIEYSNVIR